MSQHLVVKTFRATPRSLPAVIALTAVTLALYLGPVSTAEAYTGSLNNISSPAGTSARRPATSSSRPAPTW